jgi:putative salt-induced outer membrane protein
MMRLLLLLHIFILSGFAIIDVGTVDFGEKPEGFSGSAFGSFQKKRGNTDKDEMEYGGRIQYDTPETITWLQGAVEKDQVSDVPTDDNAFIHLRHIHQLFDPRWAMEFYTQAKKDKFKYLQNRSIYGAGLRYKIADSAQYGKLFVGLSAMGEKIRYTQNEAYADEHNYRLSSYLSYTIKMDKNLEFSYLGYYQPKIDNGSDYTASSTAELMIHLTRVIDLSYQLELDYDADPALNVQKKDTRQKLSFVYRFGKDDPISSYAQNLLKSARQVSELNASGKSAIADTRASVKKSFEGEWVSGGKHFSILEGGEGSFSDASGIYIEKLTWRLLPTEDATAQAAKLISIRFMDEEGRLGRVENYLWSEDSLVTLLQGRSTLFTRGGSSALNP